MKYKSETRQVECGQNLLTYTLTRKPVKNINIRIKPDGRILVSANKRVPLTYIENLIREKQEYISGVLKRFEERQKQVLPPLPAKYKDGDKIRFLGEYRIIKVIEGSPETVILDGQEIYIRVKNKDDEKRKEGLVNKWLKEQQENIFTQICTETHRMFEKYGVKYPVIKIRKMKSRWGSCQWQKGIITLNSRLIETPRICIEYVVLHEFAHFIHPNHSKKFYELVESLMPDYKVRKKELEK